MKLLTIVLALCLTTAGHAQFIIEEDYYFSKSNRPVSTKDSAYYYRETKPMPNDPNGFYSLKEYFIKDGTLKTNAAIVHPSSGFGQLFIGNVFRYFPNGNLESITNYAAAATPADTAYYFYDNKQLKHVVVYGERIIETNVNSTELDKGIPKKNKNRTNSVDKVITFTNRMPDIKHLFFFDPSGLMLVENGNGFIRFEDENGDYFEGPLVDHKKDGEWHGWNHSSAYTESYSQDIFISGIRTMEDGSKKTYLPTTKYTPPQYPGGVEKLMDYIKRNVTIRQNVFKERLLKSSHISFTVNEDGSLSDFETMKETDLNTGKEVFSVLKQGKKWIPATSQGVVVKSNFKLPFSYFFLEKPRELRERE